jgi:hypothetical protein
MNDGIVHPIASVEPQAEYRLLVTWASGDQSTVDFADDIKRGEVWAELRDAAKFAQARVAWQGRVLAWPEPTGPDGEPRIDVDADGLFEMAARQEAASATRQLISAGHVEDHPA